MAVTAAGRSAWARWWPAGLAWALWMVALLGVVTIPWFDHLLRQAGRPALTQLHAITLPSVVAALIAVTVGAVLADRRPRHPVGWLLLVLGLAVTASGVIDRYARYGLLARPGALPAARTIAGFSARLREEVDLDTLTGELLAVVEQTMRPTRRRCGCGRNRRRGPRAWTWPGSPTEPAALCGGGAWSLPVLA
jgi:hypothetical protein